MKSSFKLFSCSIPLTSNGMIRESSYTSIDSQEFLTQIRRTPALELVSRLDNGSYQILTLPSGFWSEELEQSLHVPPPLRQADAISLERIPLTSGSQAILPQRSLPWQAIPTAKEALTSLSPGLQTSKGTIPPGASFDPGTASDREIAELCQSDVSLRELLQLCRQQEEAILPQSAPVEEDLWLDILRCAGSPEPLPDPTALLVRALLPSLRFLFRFHFEARHISRALDAFLLWLEATHELEPTELFGNDIFEMQAFALPTLMVLVHADEPLKPFSVRSPASVQFFNAIQTLRADQPLGLEALKAFRSIQFGGVMAVRELGGLLLEDQIAQQHH